MNTAAGLEEPSAPYRRFAVRQIAGQVARRIVCDLRPGQTVGRGEKFGMIKLGSRTELVLPADGLQVDVRLGQKIRGMRRDRPLYLIGVLDWLRANLRSSVRLCPEGSVPVPFFNPPPNQKCEDPHHRRAADAVHPGKPVRVFCDRRRLAGRTAGDRSHSPQPGRRRGRIRFERSDAQYHAQRLAHLGA